MCSSDLPPTELALSDRLLRNCRIVYLHPSAFWSYFCYQRGCAFQSLVFRYRDGIFSAIRRILSNLPTDTWTLLSPEGRRFSHQDLPRNEQQTVSVCLCVATCSTSSDVRSPVQSNCNHTFVLNACPLVPGLGLRSEFHGPYCMARALKLRRG